jgi:hypothetical protein
MPKGLGSRLPCPITCIIELWNFHTFWTKITQYMYIGLVQIVYVTWFRRHKTVHYHSPHPIPPQKRTYSYSVRRINNFENSYIWSIRKRLVNHTSVKWLSMRVVCSLTLTSSSTLSQKKKKKKMVSVFQKSTSTTWIVYQVTLKQIRSFLCFSLFCVRVQVGFEPRKLQNKQKKISTKYIFSLNFHF